ncbi:MAG: hypothetical protein JNL01_16740 [Bdellovibrionales bacterium]|nr:hypothetical protein [Bdellovibrionales bacterium]
MKMQFVSLALAIVTSSAAFAGDNQKALNLLADAQTAFDGRIDLKQVDIAITKATDAEATADDFEIKYDAKVILARALYFKGIRTSGDKAKMAIFEQSMDRCKEAIQIDVDNFGDIYAEAHYVFAIALGRWAEAKGVLASLSKKNDLIAAAEAAQARVTRDGNPGEAYDAYGPARTLGRVYFKLPGFAGGDRGKALALLETAYANGIENALNIVYLAEVLAGGSKTDIDRAKTMLDTLLANDPNTYNPKRVAETIDEFVLAQDLRRQLGK